MCINTLLFTHIEEYFKRALALFSKILNSCCIKISAAIQTDKFTAEFIQHRIIFNNRLVTINFHNVHHGFTPFLSSHFRILDTAPLSVSNDG